MTTPARAAALLIGLALGMVATKARAWGDDGHRVIGEIAWRYLTPEAQSAVKESLTDAGYEDLAEAATWPDTFARRFSEYDPMKPLHYVNVAARAERYWQARDCPYGCVVTALTAFVALLESKDPPPSVDERRRCVYWISHFVGDLHQPLHVGHPDGKGGTATRLRFFEAPDPVSAHWIWDTGLIERRPPPDAERAPSTDQPRHRALAEELVRALTPERVTAWQRTTSAERIVDESLALAQRSAYLRSADQVNAAYAQSRWSVVSTQLSKAGVRLAAIFNRALKSPPATPGRTRAAAPPGAD